MTTSKEKQKRKKKKRNFQHFKWILSNQSCPLWGHSLWSSRSTWQSSLCRMADHRFIYISANLLGESAKSGFLKITAQQEGISPEMWLTWQHGIPYTHGSNYGGVWPPRARCRQHPSRFSSSIACADATARSPFPGWARAGFEVSLSP